MNPNLRKSRRSKASYFADSRKHNDSIDNDNQNNYIAEDSIKYIQQLKMALNEPLNKSEQNVLESLKLLRDIEMMASDRDNKEKGSESIDETRNWATFNEKNDSEINLIDKKPNKFSENLHNLNNKLHEKVINDLKNLDQKSHDDYLTETDGLNYEYLDRQYHDLDKPNRKSPVKSDKKTILKDSINEIIFNFEEGPLFKEFNDILQKNSSENSSSYPSIDERTLIHSKEKDFMHPIKPNNPFVDSHYKDDIAPSPATKLRINRVNFLLDRKSSASESENNTLVKDENIKEALRLGIALNRNKDYTNGNSVYHSNKYIASNTETNPQENYFINNFNIENNNSMNYDAIMQSQQPSFRCVEKNDNYYKFHKMLDNYQFNNEHNLNTPAWSDIKSLNLFFTKYEQEHLKNNIKINIVEPQENKPFNWNETKFTKNNSNECYDPSNVYDQNRQSLNSWNKLAISGSEQDMFETKTLQINRGEATYQSLSSRDIEIIGNTYHPFIESLGSFHNKEFTKKQEDQQDHQESTRVEKNAFPYNYEEYQYFNKFNKNSEKIEDFMYDNNDDWNSQLSNRLNLLAAEADEKVKDFIETDAIFRKNTGHEYIQNNEPNDLEVIEIDNNDGTFISSNRFTEKCSIDAKIRELKVSRLHGRETISDNNTPNKFRNFEALYFSFNHTD